MSQQSDTGILLIFLAYALLLAIVAFAPGCKKIETIPARGGEGSTYLVICGNWDFNSQSCDPGQNGIIYFDQGFGNNCHCVKRAAP